MYVRRYHSSSLTLSLHMLATCHNKVAYHIILVTQIFIAKQSWHIFGIESVLGTNFSLTIFSQSMKESTLISKYAPQRRSIRKVISVIMLFMLLMFISLLNYYRYAPTILHPGFSHKFLSHPSHSIPEKYQRLLKELRATQIINFF